MGNLYVVLWGTVIIDSVAICRSGVLAGKRKTLATATRNCLAIDKCSTELETGGVLAQVWGCLGQFCDGLKAADVLDFVVELFDLSGKLSV